MDTLGCAMQNIEQRGLLKSEIRYWATFLKFYFWYTIAKGINDASLIGKMFEPSEKTIRCKLQ